MLCYQCFATNALVPMLTKGFVLDSKGDNVIFYYNYDFLVQFYQTFATKPNKLRRANKSKQKQTKAFVLCCVVLVCA